MTFKQQMMNHQNGDYCYFVAQWKKEEEEECKWVVSGQLKIKHLNVVTSVCKIDIRYNALFQAIWWGQRERIWWAQ